MNLRTIAFSNLGRRKAKASFIILGLLISVTAVVASMGLVDTLTRDIQGKLEKYGANILIVPRTENLLLTYGGLTVGGISFDMHEILQKDLEKIRTIENSANVAAVGPMVLGPVSVTGKQVLLMGLDFGVSRFLRPWWKVDGAEPGLDGVLVGAEAARVLGLTLGETVLANGRTLTVSGILEPTGSQDDQIVFAHLTTAQSILGKEGRISMAEVAALCSGCPIEDMVQQISSVMPEANVMAIKQVVTGRMETLAHFRKFAVGLSALIVLVGAMVVLVTMMSSVRERTSEFGIFRAIGFKRLHLVQIVLMEAGLLSLIAGVAGYLAGLGSVKLAIPLFTESVSARMHLDPLLAGGVLLMAILLGLISSAYPALLAARLDPNDALRTL